MPPDFNGLRAVLPDRHLTHLAGLPTAYHCHHYNLFHDQTVLDAVGDISGQEICRAAAHRAFGHIIAAAQEWTGAATPAETLQLAASLFAWSGQGTLAFGGQGLIASGEWLHYSTAWMEKYGSKIVKRFPADNVAAGYAVAAHELAAGVRLGSLGVDESGCFALRQKQCGFTEGSATKLDSASAVNHDAVKGISGSRRVLTGLDEDRIETIANSLREFTLGIAGDEHGLIRGFGVIITLHSTEYYNETVYESVASVERLKPRVVGAVESLFGEGGHVCAFNTFGNILMSAEMESLAGPLTGKPEDTVSLCAAIARGLGFGRWAVVEHVPGERLVVQTSANYEAPYYLARYGKSDRPRCYFFANAARGMMQLASRIDWKSRPALTEELYHDLFKKNLPWDMRETRCVAMGDEYCEAVVERPRSASRSAVA